MTQINTTDVSLLSKYNDHCPRYTSYPTALEFHNNFTEKDFCIAATQSATETLSLYLHIPFCHSLCYYCGCNKIVTRHRHKADEYIQYLLQEITHRSALFKDKQVTQIHLGGGTPSFLNETQLTLLMNAIQRSFGVRLDAEISIEIDPREMELTYLDQLRRLGFNRLSIGVQDTNIIVQESINRVQSTDFIKQLVDRAHKLAFNSVNIDLIYGLPHQSLQNFSKTLSDVLSMSPERISLFSYAHLPRRFAAQRKIKDKWLPNTSEKLGLMQEAIKTLLDNHYVMIGMDHFAKHTDELAIAKNNGQLGRNFQGYTTAQDSDLLGLGVSAISQIGNTFSQNNKVLRSYYQSIGDLNHAIEKGCILNKDDIIRGYIIQQLMCNLFIDKKHINQRFNINFDDYFEFEISQMKIYDEDKLVTLSKHYIQVSEKARLIIRHICKLFDTYQVTLENKSHYSKVI
jgi:oxygen-independent coproporphyrinogen-3 oxidase